MSTVRSRMPSVPVSAATSVAQRRGQLGAAQHRQHVAGAALLHHDRVSTQASSAPCASARSTTWASTSGVTSSRLVSSTVAVTAAAVRRRPIEQHGGDDVGVAVGVPGAGAAPGRDQRARRRWAPPVDHRRPAARRPWGCRLRRQRRPGPWGRRPAAPGTAGAGTGTRPCAIVTRAADRGRSGRAPPRRRRATRARPSTPTMSTIASTAPTSWKCTWSSSIAVHRGLDLAQRTEGPSGTGGDRAVQRQRRRASRRSGTRGGGGRARVRRPRHGSRPGPPRRGLRGASTSPSTASAASWSRTNASSAPSVEQGRRATCRRRRRTPGCTTAGDRSSRRSR